jgi:hypothetical protein
MARIKISVDTDEAQRGLAGGELELPRTVAGLVATALGGEVLFIGSEQASAQGAFASGALQSLHASPDPQKVIAAFSRIEGFETASPLAVQGRAGFLAAGEWETAISQAGRLTSIFPGSGSGFGESMQASFGHADASIDLLALYDMRCAITGEHLISPEGVQQLDVVYLQPISLGGAAVPSNAIVAHVSVAWAVRHGYVTFGDGAEIIVRQAPPVSLPPFNSSGHLLLPENESYWPSHEALQFHREHVALKASGG